MLRLKSFPLASVVGRFLLVSGLALSVLSQATAAHAAPAAAPHLDLGALAQSDKTEVARGETIRFTAIATRQSTNTSPATMRAIISQQFGRPRIVENSGFFCEVGTGSYLNSPTWEITCAKSLIAPGNKSTDHISFTSVAPNRGMSSAMIVSVWPQNAADTNMSNNVAQRNVTVRRGY